MFGIILTSHGSPATRNRSELDRPAIFPLRQSKRPEDLTESRRGRQVAKVALPGPRAFESMSLSSRKADIGRARRLLAADLTYVAHPSFDDPNAHDAILASSAEFGMSASDRIPVSRDSNADSARGNRIPSREREAHMFRKMNFLKFLAGRIRDRIDPDSPLSVDLDDLERLQAEALQLKNQIVETHLPLVVSVAKRRTMAGCELCDRISDGTFALMEAVEHFDFARGFRFSTYATWAIFNELTRQDRREWRRRKVFVLDALRPARAPGIMEIEQKEAQDKYRTVVERPLRRLAEARAIHHRKSSWDRRCPRANVQANRPGPGDQQGARAPALGTRPREARGFRPSRGDRPRAFLIITKDRTTMSTSLIAAAVDHPRAPFHELARLLHEDHDIAIHRVPYRESTSPIVEPGEAARSPSPFHRSAAAATLRGLGGRTESALRRELDRFFAARPDVSHADRVAIARAMARFRNQLLHHPRSTLRAAAAADPAGAHHMVDAVGSLFKLQSTRLYLRPVRPAQTKERSADLRV